MVFDWVYKAQTLDDPKKWIRGSLVGQHIDSEYEFYIKDPFGDEVKVDPSTACRCTGILDKRGLLIFDCDTVQIGEDNDRYIVMYVPEDGMFKLIGTKKTYTFAEIDSTKCEVLWSAENVM